MFFRICWEIWIGGFKLGILDSVEVHKSVDLLADTCTIKLPATLYNKAIENAKYNELENAVKRGDEVKVWLGYDINNFSKAQPEFEGYLQGINTDDGSIILRCEDDWFLMRKKINNIQFKNVSIKTIAEYIVRQTGINMQVNCNGYGDSKFYDKFVIKDAEAYDVLKKLQQEIAGNIYIKKETANGTIIPVLHIHPLYTERHGYVDYSFQQNIEKSDLKYKSKEDRKVEITIKRQGKDGKTIEEKYGTPGGESHTIEGYGMNAEALKLKAKKEYDMRCFNGYEGSITTWLIPYVEPGYSATIKDDEYEYKNGIYYVTAVTTTLDGSGGGVRKVQLGIKLGESQQI